MRRIVVSEFLTLDGVMEAPDKWSFPFWNDEAAKFKYDELFASDALLLGRVAYQGFAAAWPSRSDSAVAADSTTGGESVERSETDQFADRMNSLPKYVVSTTLDTAEWNNSTIIKGNVPTAVADLKQQPGRDILVGGSAQLVQTLMRHNLIDEYRLLAYPVVRGSGMRLFGDGIEVTMRLVESRAFSTGVVALTYRPAAQGAEE